MHATAKPGVLALDILTVCTFWTCIVCVLVFSCVCGGVSMKWMGRQTPHPVVDGPTNGTTDRLSNQCLIPSFHL